MTLKDSSIGALPAVRALGRAASSATVCQGFYATLQQCLHIWVLPDGMCWGLKGKPDARNRLLNKPPQAALGLILRSTLRPSPV